MSYLIFARKWRPKNFDEVVGQEHITTTLKNAILQNKLAHAYIFTGPRGIGKTSCARILAKSLNCSKGQTITPCEICSSCKEINEARSLDIIEIDGASNRGIDEIRTLRENVKFAPSSTRYKVYIIDEVHMLTTEAFNALLKTLEEPPPHVMFIFATTSPHKVLPTILSRCQRFDFRRIPLLKIIEKLEEIAKLEKISIDKDALFSIAKAALGSLRDAESILDQLNAYKQDKIDNISVNTMLGLVSQDYIYALTDKLQEKDSVSALKLVSQIIDEGKDINQFIINLIEHFRNLMVSKVGGKLLDSLLDLPEELKESLLAQTQRSSLIEILDAIELLVQTQEMTRSLDSSRVALELAITKLSFTKEKNTTILSNQQLPKKDTPKIENPITIDNIEKKETVSQIDIEDKPLSTSITIDKIKEIWPEFISNLSNIKMSVATYLQEGRPIKLEKRLLVIGFPKDSGFHKESLERKENRSIIEKQLKEMLQIDLRVTFEVTHEETNSEEPLIKSALDTFKGKLINKWHHKNT